MKFSLKPVLFGSTALGMVAISFSALAMPPHEPNAYNGGNVWWLKAYEDDSSNHSFKEHRVICFDRWHSLDMHAEYDFWLDISYPNFYPIFKGTARQEGDQIFMVGDGYSPNGDRGWHDSRQWEIVSQNQGHGHLQRWGVGSPEYNNIKLTRLPWMICDCESLANYFLSVDINIDNEDTLERILSGRPECAVIESASSEETSEEVAK